MLLQKTNTTDISFKHDWWSQYNPTMMKAQISVALCQSSLQTSLPTPSTLRVLPNTNMPEDIQPTAPSIKRKAAKNKTNMSRRRPVLTPLATESLLEAKKLALDTVGMDAREEHKLQMEILHSQKEQEIEKLKQEKMKSELLKLQIQREWSRMVIS